MFVYDSCKFKEVTFEIEETLNLPLTNTVN